MCSLHGWPSRGLKGEPGWVLFCSSGSMAPLTLPTEAQDLDAIFMDTKFSSKVSGSFEKDKGVYLRLKINRDMAGTLPTADALPSNQVPLQRPQICTIKVHYAITMHISWTVAMTQIHWKYTKALLNAQQV